MHEFRYRRGQLYCENARVADVAQKVGTPFYLYSYQTLIDHFLKLKRALAPLQPLICYSVKANSNLAVLRTLVRQGAGVDVVSSGELFRALRAGADPRKIVFAGVGKTEAEIEEALRRRILFLNVESLAELETINRVAGRMKRTATVSLRLNPGVEAHTHRAITTGTVENKFGIDFARARSIFHKARQFESVRLDGVHVHIGSQITEGGPFVQALHKVLRFLTQLERKGISVSTLNLGGGLGVIYRNEKPQTAQQYADRLVPLLRGKPYRVIFEPGRFIAGNSGIFVTKVLYVKPTRRKNFVIVDGAMNDLIRPSLYGAYHDLKPVVKRPRRRLVSDVVGPVCESTDFFAQARSMPELRQGELVAVMTAGAYGFSMSSNYNSRRRVAEVMVKGNRFSVVRERETWNDLIRGERIPSFLK